MYPVTSGSTAPADPSQRAGARADPSSRRQGRRWNRRRRGDRGAHRAPRSWGRWSQYVSERQRHGYLIYDKKGADEEKGERPCAGDEKRGAYRKSYQLTLEFVEFGLVDPQARLEASAS